MPAGEFQCAGFRCNVPGVHITCHPKTVPAEPLNSRSKMPPKTCDVQASITRIGLRMICYTVITYVYVGSAGNTSAFQAVDSVDYVIRRFKEVRGTGAGALIALIRTW